MAGPACRACRGQTGDVVLDLGRQPPCDYFPASGDPGPDPVHPLQMWLCASCGLAQLVSGPTVPEEPRGTEPAALIVQASDAVDKVAAAGLLAPGARVAEYASPHGGSWMTLVAERGLTVVNDGEPADVIVDCLGLMHAADQAEALSARAARLSTGGVLLVQYHSLGTIVRRGQWNAFRHGHFAYYSTTALTKMLAREGLVPFMAWLFDLYGGTVLLAARRAAAHAQVAAPVQSLLDEEAATGVEDGAVLRGLQRQAEARADRLHDWLAEERRSERTVLGYGAASRAVALLVRAGVGPSLLPAVVDASPAKEGRRMPGTQIPIVGPAVLAADPPRSVLLFVPDLLEEVRDAYPEVEACGSRWVDAEALGC